ncbi:MAG: ribonuclease Z [Bacteroidetes bacterium]|nr:ribonuclease Z [Bacteroidota bacterium]
MQSFELTILGSSSATPTATRHPTAQVLNVHERFFLLDCGEATQIQLRRFKFKIQRIDHIFISHLHGDHYLGLSGLLGTMHLLGRDKVLHIYSPAGLKEIIDINHYHSKTFLNYDLEFHVLEGKSFAKIFEDDKMTVETIPMNHRIPCYGFLFREKEPLRNIIKEKIEEYNIPVRQIFEIKKGNDFISPDGKRIPNSELTLPPHPPRTYAYCSDTLYNESYIEQIRNVNLLYHEATFADDKAERAIETHHCTAKQAGAIAQKANAKQLIIGHYSARYKDLDVLLNEAKEKFSNTLLAIEGSTFRIG